MHIAGTGPREPLLHPLAAALEAAPVLFLPATLRRPGHRHRARRALGLTGRGPQSTARVDIDDRHTPRGCFPRVDLADTETAPDDLTVHR